MGQVFTPVRGDSTLFLQKALLFTEGALKRPGLQIHLRALNRNPKLSANTCLVLVALTA